MKQRMWPTGLVLVAQLVCATTALAQSAAGRPTPIASAGVSLGRPIGQDSAPRPFPSLGGFLPVGYSGPPTQPIVATAGISSAVEALPPRPWPSETYDPGISDFAADRPGPVPMQGMRTTVLIP